MTPPLFVPVLGRALYPGASVALDFTRNLYRSGTPVVKGSPSLLSGWTFTRASTGYAETAAGQLVAFASGAPRITDKGLLVEEARTNLLLRSQEFDNASWTKSAASVTANAVTAPDGTLTVDKLVEDGTTASHYVTQSATTTAVAHSYSVYAKAAERGFMLLWSPTTNFGRVFNLSAGTVSGTVAGVTQATADIQSCGNGWYRCTIYVTTTAAANSFRAYTMTDATTFSYAGDGTSGLYLWGAQLEAGAFATSYIPTTTASATRARDEPTLTYAPTFPITLVVSTALRAGTPNANAVQMDDGTTAERVIIFGTSGATITGFVSDGAVGQASINAGAFTFGTSFVAAMRVETNNIGISLNGAAAVTDVSATMPSPTVLRVGNSTTIDNAANGYIRRVVVYPTAFTDAQLVAASGATA